MTDAELVEALCDIENGLSGWEIDFIESIADQVEEGRDLTDKQRATAEKILEEKG